MEVPPRGSRATSRAETSCALGISATTSCTLWLLPQRCAYAPQWRTLLVADAHIGKAAHFRRLGVPVPEATTLAGLARLDQALADTQAERVIFLGDLVHADLSAAAGTRDAFDAWRRQHAHLHMALVLGNHDLHSTRWPSATAVQPLPEGWRLGPLALAHHPQDHAGAYTLCGHVHPAAWVGRGRGAVRLACFHFAAEVGVLPAFGEFTGSHTPALAADDAVYVIAEDQVLPLNSRAGRR